MPLRPPPAAKCATLSAQVGALQAEAAKQVEALKEGLARELRRQRVSRLHIWLQGGSLEGGT